MNQSDGNWGDAAARHGSAAAGWITPDSIQNDGVNVSTWRERIGRGDVLDAQLEKSDHLYSWCRGTGWVAEIRGSIDDGHGHDRVAATDVVHILQKSIRIRLSAVDKDWRANRARSCEAVGIRIDGASKRSWKSGGSGGGIGRGG